MTGILHIPAMVGGQFHGVVELIWSERWGLVFEQ